MIFATNASQEYPTLPGRDYHVSGLGIFDGATVTLETYVDGAWRAVPDGSWTTAFSVVATNGAGTALRLVVSGAGASTSLSLNLTETTR